MDCVFFFTRGSYKITNWTIKLSLAVMSFTGFFPCFTTWHAADFRERTTQQTRLLDWISMPTANALQQLLEIKKTEKGISYDGNGSQFVCNIDFSLKGLKSRLLWAGWSVHSCSAPLPRCTELRQNWNAFSHQNHFVKMSISKDLFLPFFFFFFILTSDTDWMICLLN